MATLSHLSAFPKGLTTPTSVAFGKEATPSPAPKANPGPLAIHKPLEDAPAFFTQKIAAYTKAHAPKPPIMLTIGIPDVEPPKTFKDAMAYHASTPGQYYYTTMGFTPKLAKAVTNWLQHRFNIEVNRNQLLPYSGTNEAIIQLINGVVKPNKGDAIWMPDPYYPSFKTAADFGGWQAKLAPITVNNQYEFDYPAAWNAMSDDEQKAVKALVLISPNNPTGAKASKAYLQKVVNFAKQHNLLIINDLAYADIYPTNGTAPTSLLELDGADDANIVEFHSFSKGLAIPGARAGFAIFSKPLLEKNSTVNGKKSLYQAALENRANLHASGLFPLVQQALADTLNQPEKLDAYLKGNRDIYQQRADFVRHGLTELGWQVVSDRDNSTPFYLWVKVPEAGKSSEEFSNSVIDKTGVAMIPGAYFGPSGEGYLRVAMTKPTKTLAKALQRLKDADCTYPSNA